MPVSLNDKLVGRITRLSYDSTKKICFGVIKFNAGFNVYSNMQFVIKNWQASSPEIIIETDKTKNVHLLDHKKDTIVIN
ncbi:hypothetical protein LK994_06340 [Ferruginibacter lapsinanis]|uniref:hypothetical protein n=1 Tax=Ferruginibacter lapsinanis TaxID=563172 RepID=UPI001E307B18|nr:hypothetical protein [Ferruginibacter lapsinanis]UEG51093.1 hypothetical protein LK994_06340 [Ferruginibacter lapsinanis]